MIPAGDNVQEQKSFLSNTVYLVIQIVLITLFAVIVLYFFISSKPVLFIKHMESTALEISENLFSSPLTKEWAVFSFSQLNRYHGKIDEPYARHCSIAYRLEIESDIRKWTLGFEPNRGVNPATGGTPFFGETHLGFLNEYTLSTASNVDGKPARISLTIYERSLTHITCLIENAYKMKSKQQITCKMPSKGYRTQLPNEMKEVTCRFILEKIGSDMCIGHPDFSFEESTIECRSLPGINVASFAEKEEVDVITDMKLVAIPLKTFAPTDCSSISDDIIAGKDDEVGIVVLCLERE